MAPRQQRRKFTPQGSHRLGVALVVSVLCASMVTATTATATPPKPGPDRVVYPTGVYPDDLLNVYEAVSEGGTVLLKHADRRGRPTAFEFGDGETQQNIVYTAKDVTILGETSRGHQTTIRGGGAPFAGTFTQFLPLRTTIRGIHFDRPHGAAVRVTASASFDFSDNTVTDIVGTEYFGSTKAQAVWVNGAAANITGRVEIRDNVVDNTEAFSGWGVALYFHGAEVHITGNEFRNITTAGVLAGMSSGAVVIDDNLIVPGPERYPGPGSWGGGILVEGNGPARIRRNTIIAEHPAADGIAITGFGDRPSTGNLIERNTIAVRSTPFSAITFFGKVSHTDILRNEISGRAAHAWFLGVWPEPGESAVGNTFAHNRLASFVATTSDIFLDTHTSETTVTGKCDIVIDLGTGNRVDCKRRPGEPPPRSAPFASALR